jgi:hypothetical protein
MSPGYLEELDLSADAASGSESDCLAVGLRGALGCLWAARPMRTVKFAGQTPGVQHLFL